MSEPIWTTIKVTKTDPHIGVLTMSRLAQRNAINAQMADELEKCLESLKSDRDLRALILTGEGTTFGAGADLKERALLAPEQTQKARRGTALYRHDRGVPGSRDRHGERARDC